MLGGWRGVDGWGWRGNGDKGRKREREIRKEKDLDGNVSAYLGSCVRIARPQFDAFLLHADGFCLNVSSFWRGYHADRIILSAKRESTAAFWHPK